MDSWNDKFKDTIKSVAIDLWGPYRSVVESKLPNAKAVADRFHVMQNLNKVLDNCRKQAKFDNWVSSGFVESVNNKIKLIKRKAFGFVNFENFRGWFQKQPKTGNTRRLRTCPLSSQFLD